ncbi:MAG: hypothetical protein Q8891_09030 [Bacteroidota bacterium]|nr:hypothetical protein [Bacteroidota bacterium]
MITFLQRILLLFIVSFCCISSIHAQVKIGSNPTIVNANSLLELESTGKGVLLPRSSSAQIIAMTSVPTGMILFNTTDSALYLKRDTGWVVIPVSMQGVNATLQPTTTPSYADFYALMPGDNAAPVAVGGSVEFPQDGPASGTISRSSSTTFNLQDIGTYQVMFQVSVSEAGQLVVALNGTELAYTVVGRATGTSQIVGMCIITTTSANSVLDIRNPASGFAALTITPLAGGVDPVSAHLIITKLQ